MRPPFRTAYSPHFRVTLTCEDPTRTKQSMAQECEINFIMAKFQKTGVINHLSKHQGQYQDFEPIEFQEAMNIVTTAESMFAELPSSIRAEFGNDAGHFLAFANNPDNAEELKELGLAPTPPASAAPQEPVTGSKPKAEAEGPPPASD